MISVALRAPTPAMIAFVGASVVAASGQYLLGRDWPVVHVAFLVLTLLALGAHPDRWATALLTLHVGVFAVGNPPTGLIAWAVAVALAGALGCVHLLAAWLPWRHCRLTLSARTGRAAGAQVLSMFTIAGGAAALAAAALTPAGVGPGLAVLALGALTAAVALEAHRVRAGAGRA